MEKPRRKQINVDSEFVNWIKNQRALFEKQTGIPATSDLKFTAVLMRGDMLRIKMPRRRRSNVRF